MSARHYARQRQAQRDRFLAAAPKLADIRAQLEALNPGRIAVVAGVAVERCTRAMPWGEHTDGYRVGDAEPVSLLQAAQQLADRPASTDVNLDTEVNALLCDLYGEPCTLLRTDTYGREVKSGSYRAVRVSFPTGQQGSEHRSVHSLLSVMLRALENGRGNLDADRRKSLAERVRVLLANEVDRG